MEQQKDPRAVLLVEDEVLVRLSIADDLRRAGLTVLEAANADEAVTVLTTRADSVGVLLTDLQMPGSIDGLGLIRIVRERYPDVRIVVLSGAHLEVLASVHADGVFSKPHVPAQLERQIKHLLGERTDNGSRNSNARKR